MRFNDRAMALLGIPDLPEGAFEKHGAKIKLYGGSPPSQTTSYQTNIPEYAEPYVTKMLGSAAVSYTHLTLPTTSRV